MNYESTIVLRDGTKCTIRTARAEDAREVMDCFVRTHEETDFLLTYPDETGFTEEQEAGFLRARAESGNEIELCAVVNGEMVGTAGIGAVGTKEKVRHRAEFGISVRKAHWGRGIGRALTEACIACAKAAGYAQVELEVVADNAPAIALYESVGFREYGRNPRGFRSRFTGWQEVVLMRLELSSGDPTGG